MECGGSLRPSPAPKVRLMTREDTGFASPPLLFGDDCDCQGHINVRVQMQLDLMIAGDADRTGRHAYFAAADRLTRFDGRLGDIGGADRAEQLAFRTCLGLEFKLEVLELQGARLRRGQFLARLGHRGASGGNEEIARIPGFDLDAIADLTEVRDLLQQYDVHVRSPI